MLLSVIDLQQRHQEADTGTQGKGAPSKGVATDFGPHKIWAPNANQSQSLRGPWNRPDPPPLCHL